MKRLIPLLCLPILFACSKNTSPNAPPVTTDSSVVTVTNGYGSGKYKVGDTVHIYSVAYTDNQLFDTWSSVDLSLLNASQEWRCFFSGPFRRL